MIFSTENPFTKFFFDEDDHDKGWVDLRTLSVSEIKKIRKATVKKKFEFKRSQRYEVEDVNEKLRDELTWNYCIGEWNNVLDEEGNERPNTKEQKLELMHGSPAFAAFVGQKLEELGELQEQLKEAEEKN